MVEKASKKFVVIVDETKVSITGCSSSVKWLDEGPLVEQILDHCMYSPLDTSLVIPREVPAFLLSSQV
jgi:hypothetical protein